ncbi:MAG: saccharopine dehydrogenase, partial [Pseudomonadota bacterium]
LIGRFALPQPGQGPGRAARAGRPPARRGTAPRSARPRASGVVSGARDPGYGSTSRMVVEAALALLHDVDRTATPGGVWTAGAALGLALVRRLEAHAGLRFEIAA